MKLDTARRGLLLVALAAGAVFIYRLFTDAQPLSEWIALRLLVIWASAALFAGASLVAGHRVVQALMGDTLEPIEHWPLAFSTGVLCFFTAVFLGGILGWYGSIAFFIGLPLVLVLFGWRSFLTRVAREHAEGRWRLPKLTALELACGCGLVIGLFLVLLPVVEPETMSFDVQWYHVPIAEHYFAAGRIEPFVEGRLTGVIPQLVSVIYVWALHLPAGGVWDRMVLCLHLEGLAVLGTIAALPALCRALSPVPMRGWVGMAAFFLFPAIFIYDTGLHGGSDHFCALFSAPAWLALLRFWPRLDSRAGALLSLQVAGLILCKYVAVSLVAVVGLAVAIRIVWLAARARPGLRFAAVWPGPLWCLLALLAATSPHWLKNWVFYGGPVYPFLGNVFHHTIWSADSQEWVKQFAAQPFSAQGSWGWKLYNALQAMIDFSWEPSYCWSTFHGKQPATGSVFSMLLLSLPFLKAGWRVWAIALGVELGVGVWYLSTHQERYLLILVPLMAAAVVVMIASAWREGWPFRLLVLAILAVQLVGAADLPFYPRAWARKESSPAHAMALLGGAYLGEKRNYERYTAWSGVTANVPKSGKVLWHQSFASIGLERQTVMDLQTQQFGLNYGRLGSLGGVHDWLVKNKVTHLGWHGSHEGTDSIAGELIFHGYLSLVQTDGPTMAVYRVPAKRPAEHGDVVQYVGCDGTYKTGLYRLSQLVVTNPAPIDVLWPAPFEPGLVPQKAEWMAIETACRQGVDVSGFRLLVSLPSGSVELYHRAQGL